MIVKRIPQTVTLLLLCSRIFAQVSIALLVQRRRASNYGKWRRLITAENARAFSVGRRHRCERGAIYFAKRKLRQPRRIAPFPRDKRAARWLKCFKENRSSRLCISFEESCKGALTATRASYWTKNSNSSISGEYGAATVFAYIVHSRSC